MIKPLEEKDCGFFFAYLDEHLQRNGKGDTPLFQPASRTQAGFPKEKEAGFVEGMHIAIGSPKWRRAWMALDENGAIIGHADLRARAEPCCSHRALLGMGVHHNHRKSGIGTRLVEFVTQWARDTGVIEIVDLAVLSGNLPAIRLYEKTGFKRICEIEDMFRIDGRSEADILMAKRLFDV